jgi:hypothetical protein
MLNSNMVLVFLYRAKMSTRSLRRLHCEVTHNLYRTHRVIIPLPIGACMAVAGQFYFTLHFSGDQVD